MDPTDSSASIRANPRPTPSLPAKVKCPKCGTENYAAELICYACGEPLRKLPWRPRAQPLDARSPGLLWFALFALIALGGFFAYQGLLVARAQLALLPPEDLMKWQLGLLIGGAALPVIGQVVFFWARFKEKEWWHWKRAPLLPMKQTSPGDTVWLRGQIRCDAPLVGPISFHACVYYHYLEQVRGSKGGWQTVKNEKQQVDFRLEQDGETVYIPSGSLLYDAPLALRTGGEFPDQRRYTEYALFTDMPAAVCGTLADFPDGKRLDAVGDGVPALVTYQSPTNYLNDLSRQVHQARFGAWCASVLGFFALALRFMR